MRRGGYVDSADLADAMFEDVAIYDNATNVSAEAISLPTPGRTLESDD